MQICICIENLCIFIKKLLLYMFCVDDVFWSKLNIEYCHIVYVYKCSIVYFLF